MREEGLQTRGAEAAGTAPPVAVAALGFVVSVAFPLVSLLSSPTTPVSLRLLLALAAAEAATAVAAAASAALTALSAALCALRAARCAVRAPGGSEEGVASSSSQVLRSDEGVGGTAAENGEEEEALLPLSPSSR